MLVKMLRDLYVPTDMELPAEKSSDLARRINTFLETPDVNASLFSLLGWVFVDNHCMFKCIQNFMDLSKKEDMGAMFSAMTYSTAMGHVKRGQDFVVVYTYEPSKYLNNSASEFKDDSFMLNEEFYSPIAVRSRGADNDGKSYYKIPAFLSCHSSPDLFFLPC